MASNKERGRYIVWEGSDGVGKGTQMKLALAESARRGIETLAVFEPGYTQLGQTLRHLVLGGDEHIDPETELGIYLTDRSHLARQVIAPALAHGIDVHSDRSWLSGIPYQGKGGGMDIEKLIEMHRLMMPEFYMKPDLNLVFQLETQERLRRKHLALVGQDAELDRMERKGLEFYESVDQGYEYVIRRFGAYGIDASGTPDEVATRWWGLVFPPELDLAS